MLYHGSPARMDVITPQNWHGDPAVTKNVIFASPHKAMAMAYMGRKWGDRDISQGYWGNPEVWTLSEMRPGAFKAIFGSATGYLYEVPRDKFEAHPDKNHKFELVSNKRVKPISRECYVDVLTFLHLEKTIVLEPYDPEAVYFHRAVRRIRKRLAQIREVQGYSVGEGYLGWIKETNPYLHSCIMGFCQDII